VLLITSRQRMRGIAAVLSFLCFAAFVAGAAGGAPGPRLQADQPALDLSPGSTSLGRASDTELDVYLPSSIEMAKVTLFVPGGYGVDLAKAPGTQLGVVVAWGPDGLGRLARIDAADPAAYTTSSCAPGLHQAVWLMTFGATTQLPPIPLLVDQTSGSDVALGAYKAQACLPASASGTLRIRELDLGFIKSFTNPSSAGAYTWRAFVTPFAAGVPNDAGTFELRATVPLPMRLTLHGSYDRKHKRAILAGRLTASHYAVRGVFLSVHAEKNGHFRGVGYTTTTGTGAYRVFRRITHTTRFAVATATWDDCAPGTVAPGGCVSDTLADVSSGPVKVVVRRR
jgi:hypothetical protein